VIALAFEQPLALSLLAVPIVLLVIARRRTATRALAVGDLEPWREARRTSGAPRAARPRPPTLASLLAVASLVCAVLALAGPRSELAQPRWTCVLDTTASMDLEFAGSTRRARAIDMARALAREHDVDLAWMAARGGRTVASTPEAALDGTVVTTDDTFAAWDVPGALWITDAIPSDPPRYAGFVASGGPAVHGGIALEGRDRIDWDGERLVVVTDAAPGVLIGGLDALSPRSPFERVLAAWLGARGHVTGDDSLPVHVPFSVHVSGESPKGEVLAGRDGWNASGQRLGSVRLDRDEDRGLTPWITAGDDVLVAAGPGRIHFAWLPGEPSAGPEFAVSWARLFDEIALQPFGIVSLDERRAAGEARSEAPAAPDHALPTNNAWILAMSAAVLALGAISARLR